jgi:hypothetical protein
MARPQANSDPTAVERRRSTGAPGALHHQRATPWPRHDPFAVEWALPDDEIGPVDVVLSLGATDVALVSRLAWSSAVGRAKSIRTGQLAATGASSSRLSRVTARVVVRCPPR